MKRRIPDLLFLFSLEQCQKTCLGKAKGAAQTPDTESYIKSYF